MTGLVVINAARKSSYLLTVYGQAATSAARTLVERHQVTFSNSSFKTKSRNVDPKILSAIGYEHRGSGLYEGKGFFQGQKLFLTDMKGTLTLDGIEVVFDDH